MGFFKNKESKDAMHKVAEQEVKKIFKAKKMEIATFLAGFTQDDQSLFYKAITELEELTAPYIDAACYPMSLEEDIKRIGEDLNKKFGKKGQDYASVVYAVKAAVFAGQIRSIWMSSEAQSLF